MSEERRSALDRQVGGDHYKGLAIQPLEYCHANGLGKLEGDVIAYVTRWRSKGGLEDLRKAVHELEVLIELEEAAERRRFERAPSAGLYPEPPRPPAPEGTPVAFAQGEAEAEFREVPDFPSTTDGLTDADPDPERACVACGAPGPAHYPGCPRVDPGADS